MVCMKVSGGCSHLGSTTRVVVRDHARTSMWGRPSSGVGGSCDSGAEASRRLRCLPSFAGRSRSLETRSGRSTGARIVRARPVSGPGAIGWIGSIGDYRPFGTLPVRKGSPGGTADSPTAWVESASASSCCSRPLTSIITMRRHTNTAPAHAAT